MPKIAELIIETCSHCPFIDWKYDNEMAHHHKFWCEKEKIWLDNGTNVLKEIDRSCGLKDFK